MRRTLLTLATALALALSGGAVALASEPAPEPEQPAAALTIDADVDVCGAATLTYSNSSALGAYVFDYRLPGETGIPDEVAPLLAKEGPLAGQTFGPLYHPTSVPKGQTAQVTVTLDEDRGDGTVVLHAGVRRGPEQHELLDWIPVTVRTDCAPPVDDPGPDPGTDDPSTDDPGAAPGQPGAGGGITVGDVTYNDVDVAVDYDVTNLPAPTPASGGQVTQVPVGAPQTGGGPA